MFLFSLLVLFNTDKSTTLITLLKKIRLLTLFGLLKYIYFFTFKFNNNLTFNSRHVHIEQIKSSSPRYPRPFWLKKSMIPYNMHVASDIETEGQLWFPLKCMRLGMWNTSSLYCKWWDYIPLKFLIATKVLWLKDKQDIKQLFFQPNKP